MAAGRNPAQAGRLDTKYGRFGPKYGRLALITPLSRASQRYAAEIVDDPAAGTCNHAENKNCIPRAVIPAELAAFKAWRADKNEAAAIAALQEAVSALAFAPYNMPPMWYYPSRQCLGYALLNAAAPTGDAAAALEVFNEDLEEYPKNGYSLLGAAQVREGEGEREGERE